MTMIYKIAPGELWREAEARGTFEGAPIDAEDGYIHLSAADQVRETAARYFGGIDDLVLVGIDADRLGDALKWEPSRGGAPFPHLYAPLSLADIAFARPLLLGAHGFHLFPADIP